MSEVHGLIYTFSQREVEGTLHCSGRKKWRAKGWFGSSSEIVLKLKFQLHELSLFAFYLKINRNIFLTLIY